MILLDRGRRPLVLVLFGSVNDHAEYGTRWETRTPRSATSWWGLRSITQGPGLRGGVSFYGRVIYCPGVDASNGLLRPGLASDEPTSWPGD